MPVSVGSIEVLLELRDKLQAQLQSTKGSLTRLSGEIRKVEADLLKHAVAADKTAAAHRRSGDAISKFGSQIRTTLVHVAAAGAAYKALGAAISSVRDQVEFERTMNKIANVTGVTREEITKFKTEIAGLVQATGRGPQELAEGFYFIASNGFKGAEATKILTESAKLAAIGLGETNTIARSLAAAINAYGKENLTAAQAADQLLAGVRAGGAEAAEVASTFGRIVGTANTLGISFAELQASVATFTRVGVKADEAVTALRGTMQALLNPSKAGEEALLAMHKAGLVTSSTFAELRKEIKDRGLATVLIDLVQAAGDNVEILGDLIPNSRALAGVLANAGSQAGAYKQILKETAGAHGDVDRAMEDTRTKVSFMWDQLGGQMEQLKLTLGEALLPSVIKFGEALLDIDPKTVIKLGEAVGVLIEFIGLATKAVVNFGDAAANAFVRLRAHLPGLDAFAKFVKDGITHFNNFLTYSERADSAMVDMAASAKRAGDAQARLFHVRQGGTIRFSEYEQLKKDAVEAAAAVTELARKRDALKTKDDDAIREARQAVEVEMRRRDAINETIRIANERNLITRDAVLLFRQAANASGGIKLPNEEAEKFAQRLGEVTQRLSDQRELAEENLKLAKARLAFVSGGGSADELQDAVELTQTKRIQLEVDKQIAALENSKRAVGASVRKEIEAQVAATIRLNDEAKATNELVSTLGTIQKNNSRLAGELAKVLRSHNEALGDEMTRRVAGGFAFQNTVSQKQLDLSRELLAAWIEGGDLAARAAEIMHRAQRESIPMTQAQAEALARVADEQDRVNYLISKVAELSKPAWQTYLDAAFGAIDAVGTALSDVLYQAAMEGKVSWESVWEGLKSSLIRIFADMLADMVRRWIAAQLAMRAASQSINAGGNVTGGGGGLTGSLTNMGLTAMTGGGTATGTGASAGTLAMWANAAFALYVVYRGFIEDHKRKFASVTVGGTGEILSTAAHGKKYLQGALDAATDLLKALKDWVTELDIEVTKFASITITNAKEGFITPLGIFKAAEEALDSAAAFMVRFGEFAESVPALVQAAIRGTSLDNLSMETISSNIAFARELLTQNMEQIAVDMESIASRFVDQVRRSMTLFGGSDLLQAVDSSILHFTSSLQALYDQLTGHEADPREQAERLRLAYNAQRAIVIAQITLLYEEIKARIAAIQAHIAFIQTIRQGGGEPGGFTGFFGGSGATEGGGRGRHGGSKGGGAFVEPTPDARNPTNNPQIATLLQVLDNLARALQGLPGEIAPGGVKPGRGGRGGGGGQLEGVRDFISDTRFQLAQAGRSPLQQEIESIRRSFAEQLEAAGKNVKLRQELLALETQSIEAARARFQEDVQNRFNEMVGRTNAFTELRKRFADMRQEIGQAGYAASRAAEMLADLADAEERALQVLADETMASILGGLAQYITDEGLRAEMVRQQEILNFQLKMAQLEIEYRALMANADVSAQAKAAAEAAFNWIRNNAANLPGGSNWSPGGVTPPRHWAEIGWSESSLGTQNASGQWSNVYVDTSGNRWAWSGSPMDGHWVNLGAAPGGGWSRPPGGSGTGGGTSTTGGSGQSAIERARELLDRYLLDAMNPWEQALRRLNDDFAIIRQGLGDTPEVMQAYADALARLREEFLSGLQDFYDQLQGGALGGATVMQQFESAAARYQQLLAQVQGGDLSQADALQRAAQEYIQLATQMFGTSTGGFATIRQQILADLAAILGIQVPALGSSLAAPMLGANVIGGADHFTSQLDTSMRATVMATQNVASVIDIASRAEIGRLDTIIARLDSLENVVRGEGAGESVVVGDDPRGGVMLKRKGSS